MPCDTSTANALRTLTVGTTEPGTAGLEPVPSYLYIDWIDWAFQSTSREEAQRKYCSFVSNASSKKSKLDLSGTVLGTPAFANAVREAAAEADSDGVLPRTYRSLGRPTLPALFGMSWSHEERNRLIYQAHVEYGYRLVEIAIFLELHPSTISLVVRGWKQST